MSRSQSLRGVVAAWLALACVGCEDAANAPFEHAKGGIAAKEHARALAAQSNAERLLQAFQVAEGRNPRTIEELEEAQGELKTPPRGMAWSYDAEAGRIELIAE